MKHKKAASVLLAALMTTSLSVVNAKSIYAEENTEEEIPAETNPDPNGGSTGDENTVPSLSVESDILGLADTNNKSSLKEEVVKAGGPGDTNIYYYDEETGERLVYENQMDPDFSVKGDTVKYQGSATLSLGDNVDDSKIGSSNAVVKLVDGNGYYADEFILSELASKLSGKWENGKLTYELSEGDLEWNSWDYYAGLSDDDIDTNSGREWSMMGGDGNGVYYFNLEVSGIVYDGQEVAAAKIPVAVYIYGRSSADLGIGTEFVENKIDENYTAVKDGYTVTEPTWTWSTENASSKDAKVPYLNDPYTDYFSVQWPTDMDASGITADDVTVTLKSAYGDEYVLQQKTEYGETEYGVISRNNETVVAVTYQQWAYIPVYSSMTIEIKKPDGSVLSQDYDITSVTAYMVQTGGGGQTVDHTVTAYNYYGVEGVKANTSYTLSTIIDGIKKFYAEKENGEGYLVDGVEVSDAFGFKSIVAPDNAWQGDGEAYYHIDVINNVVFAESRENTEEVKYVAGAPITFTQNLNVTYTIKEMLEQGATLQSGYNLDGSSADKWAWTKRYQSGWHTTSGKPTSLPYSDTYPYGFTAEEGHNPVYDDIKPSGPMGPGGPGGPGSQGPDNQDPMIENPEENGIQDTQPVETEEVSVETTSLASTDSVHTSTATHAAAWVTLLVAAVGGLAAVIRRKRQEI